MIAFTVYGLARPGGSKRAFRNPRTDRIALVDSSGKAGKDWRRMVADAGAEAMGSRAPFADPLAVSFDFFRPHPRSHYRTGRNAELLRDAALRWPISRPDLLKMARLAEDALTLIVWRDDSIIVEEHLRTSWGHPARMEVTVRPVDAELRAVA